MVKMVIIVKDVVKKVGVVILIVLCVINDYFSIFELIKKKVWKVMDDLGYVLNMMVWNLGKWILSVIGVILFFLDLKEWLGNLFYLEIMEVINEEVCFYDMIIVIVIVKSFDVLLENVKRMYF